MSKLSFEKGQKIAKVYHEDPIKNEILKLVIKKLVKKHLKGGVTEDDLNRTFNSDAPGAYFEYLRLKEIYDEERKPKKIFEKATEPTFREVVEEKEKEEIKELKVKIAELEELKKAAPPRAPLVRLEALREALTDNKKELLDKRNELREITEDLGEVNYRGDFVINSLNKREKLKKKH